MRKLILIFLLCGAAGSLVTPHLQATATAQTIVTASQVNGTWRSKNNTFKVWAMGNQKLQVEFSGVYEYNSPSGATAHTGFGSGIAFIEGDTATFKPEGAEDGCQITMKFTRGKLVVTQEGICGFGHNVSAEGTYKKISTRKPKFDEGGCGCIRIKEWPPVKLASGTNKRDELQLVAHPFFTPSLANSLSLNSFAL